MTLASDGSLVGAKNAMNEPKNVFFGERSLYQPQG